MILFLKGNISEFLLINSGVSKLRYITLFLDISVISFAASIPFIVLYIIDARYFLNTKTFSSIFIVVLVVFCMSVLYFVDSTQDNYNEYSVYSIDDTDIPNENIKKFLPYYDSISAIIESNPDYSFSSYSNDHSCYINSQTNYYLYNDLNEPASLGNTVEYFKTDKSYMMGKYIAEKVFLYSLDEDGNIIPNRSVKHYEDGELYYDVITLKTEKRFITKRDDFFFSFVIQDNNILDISDEEFISMGLEQFSNMAEFHQDSIF